MEGQPHAPRPGPSGPPPGSGLTPNLAGALAYLLGALTGILFLIIDRDRPFIRFHAVQSILLSVAGFALALVIGILSLVLGAIPVIGWLVSVLLSLGLWIGAFVLWVYLMYRAYRGDEWEVPVVGPYARQLAGQIR